MSTAPDTNDTAQASAPAKRPGRPRTAEQPLTPAQRQKLYKMRRDQARHDAATAAIEHDREKLAACTHLALIDALGQSIAAIDSDTGTAADLSIVRGALFELVNRYGVFREDDENQE